MTAINPHQMYLESGSEPEWSKLVDRRDRVERIMDGTSSASPRYAELVAELAVLNAAIKIALQQEGI